MTGLQMGSNSIYGSSSGNIKMQEWGIKIIFGGCSNDKALPDQTLTV